MLKDTLAKLMTKKPCVVGDAMEAMDAEGRTAFREIMQSSVGDNTISVALKAEGILLSRSALTKHRECFDPKTKAICKCYPPKEAK